MKKFSYIAFTVLIFFTAISCDDDNKTNFSIVPSLGFESDAVKIDNDDLEITPVSFYTNTAITEQVTVTIQVNNIGNVAYGIDYTTEPEPDDNGVITLTLNPDDDLSFSFNPITASDAQVQFLITSVSGNDMTMAQAAANLTTVTVGAPAPFVLLDGQISIADVRAYNTSLSTTPIALPKDKFIQGTVITVGDNVNAKNLYIQDGTAGIEIYLASASTFSLGDVVRLPLSSGDGVYISAYNNTLELITSTAAGINSTNLSQVGTGSKLKYKTITAAEFNTGAYEGRLVRIANVTFPAADGTTKTVSGSTTFTDATGSGIMYVYSGASFSSQLLPTGTVTIKGLAVTYKTTYEFEPVSATDIP